MNEDLISKCSNYLINCRKKVIKIKLQNFMPKTEIQAYRIQNNLHKILNKDDDKIIGKKIGCTTPVMQNYLGIKHPCAGTLRENQCYQSGSILKYENYCKVGVECELAISLSKDIFCTKSPNVNNLYSSIDKVFAAIEIVDDRYLNWNNFPTNYLIADDFFSSGCVLGDYNKYSELRDLKGMKGRMLINNIEVGEGIGKDILGDPINALIWIVSRKEIIGEFLPKGSIILLGSLVQTKWLNQGDIVEVDINKLGKAKVSFT